MMQLEIDCKTQEIFVRFNEEEIISNIKKRNGSPFSKGKIVVCHIFNMEFWDIIDLPKAYNYWILAKQEGSPKEIYDSLNCAYEGKFIVKEASV